jgi:phosphoglycolate phosphatase
VRGLIGGGAKKMLERALNLTGGYQESELGPLYHELLRFYEANIAVHTHLYPGAMRMLDALAEQGVKMAVVTNKFEAFAAQVLGELDLSDRFYTVIGGDTLGPGKAKPARDQLDEMIARGLALGGGGRAAYVGDTSYDTRAAQAAGIPCVAVSFGFNDVPMDELGANAVIDHFDQLIPALARL